MTEASGTFTYQGREYELFDHNYNGTITNERAVEIPIARAFIAGCEGAGLEVGNVLDHYGCTAPRRVVDLYEKGYGCDNIDVFDIEGTYDWIVSVSTIEHVRFPDNEWGGVAALAYLRGLLRPGGHMLVTIGLGQNPILDDCLLDRDSVESALGQAFGARVSLLTRTRTDDPAVNEWDCGWMEIGHRTYGPTHGANAVWIGEWGPV